VTDPEAPARPRVLVIRGGAIGDFILTLPAIQLLRSGLPVEPHLEILGYPPVTALALAAGVADAARPLEHAGLATFFVPGAELDPGWSNYFASFDLVVSYLFDPDGYFRENLARSGAETILQGPGKIDPSKGTHASEQLAEPLQEIALYLEEPVAGLDLGGRAGRGAPAGPPLVAVHPGSGSPRKNWGFENWAEVATVIAAQRPGARFLLATGEAEHDQLGDLLGIFAATGLPFTSAHGRPLTELAGQLARADLFLGHDSGVGHLAAALGIPSVLVFGPTDPAVWAPRSPQVTVVQAPRGNLGALEPPTVADAALAALGEVE
jgi:ADP-heptose:LPS heptosyltransferase